MSDDDIDTSHSVNTLMEKVLETLGDGEGGQLVLSRRAEHDKTPEGAWLCSMMWGLEAPDSPTPMAGAAAYGFGDTASTALENMLTDAGVLE